MCRDSTPDSRSEFPDPTSTVPVTVPELGTDGVLVRISACFVEVGDLIDIGEPVLEVVMTGITCDICSPASGRISRLVSSLDAVVSPGDVVALVDTGRAVAE